jgi:uncharacterized membrane protein YqjE
MVPPGQPTEGGLFNSLRRILDSALALGQTRLEILSLDLQEEKLRVVDLLVRVGLMVVLVFLALMTGTAALVIWLWPSAPAAALGSITLLYAAGALFLGVTLRRRLRHGRRPFADTLAEFRKDRECLRKGS